MALFQTNPQAWSTATGSSSSPDALANDLTSLFEAAGGYQTIGNEHVDASQPQDGLFNANGADGIESMAHAYGGDDGLSNILKELF
jgi:hypothetical protein